MLFGKSSDGGLVGLLKKLAAQVVSLLETRAELLAVELREEKIRLVQLLIWTSCTLFLAAITLVMLTFTVLFAVWDDERWRLGALLFFTLFYGGGAVFGAYKLRSMLLGGELPFSETLHQLKKDKDALQPKGL